MQMTIDRNPWKRNARRRNACLPAAVLAAGLMVSGFADARPIHDRAAGYRFPCAAIDRIGDGPFQYRGNCDGPAHRSRRHHAARSRTSS